MASKSRPVSLLHPSSSSSHSPSSFSVDHPSPPGTGHYHLRRFSYIPDLSEHQVRVSARPCSILGTASFTSMGFKLRERAKDDMHSLPRPDSPSIRLNDRPSTSHGLFSRHIPKGLKKATSLAPRSRPNTPIPIDEKPPIPMPSHFVNTPATLSESPSLATLKGRPEGAAEQSLRKDEHRQSPLRPVRRTSLRPKKTVWTRQHNMKTHTLRNQATYMQAYDPILLDNDRHFDILLRRLNALESPSFHDYALDTPSRILDLGCGAGHWLLEASGSWNQSSLTGFDIVDILIPEVQSNERIEFVQGNFLQTPWPFPDKTFDFVRMANLSLCIPYDKWETVLGQAHRVLAIGGRLELIDDQIFFPYAPQTTPPQLPVMGTSAPKSVAVTRGASFFEMDDSDDDTDSVETESTLIGEGETHSNWQKSAPSGDTLTSPIFATPETPATPSRNKLVDSSGAHSWGVDAATSRNLETIFQNMLHQKYGIHSRPSEFIVDVMQHVFGNGEKSKSFHLKLAPKDTQVELGEGGGDTVIKPEGSEKEEKVTVEPRKVGLKELTRTWFSGDSEEKLFKRFKAPSLETQHSSDSESSLTRSCGRSRENIPQLLLQIPENVSAKAATRLGLPMSSERKNDDLLEPSPAIRRTKSLRILTLFTPSSTSSPSTTSTATPTQSSESASDQDSPTGSVTQSRLSAKAAHRLGISYSALTQAAASAKAARRPASSSSTLVSSPLTTIQSPGLIIWPSKFIPLSPSELEMHACKNVHTLLGCKPALVEYVDSFRDEEGNRIESDESLNQALWDYECFRRRRFHWPSEIPEWDTDPETDAPELLSTIKPADDPKPNSNLTAASDASSYSLITPYKPDELPHVRTLRVYEAIKTDDYSLSSLQFPRSPPPSPPSS